MKALTLITSSRRNGYTKTIVDRLTIGIQVDRFFSEQLGNIFVCRLFIAAEIQKLITVAHDRFPGLFKQRL